MVRQPSQLQSEAPAVAAPPVSSPGDVAIPRHRELVLRRASLENAAWHSIRGPGWTNERTSARMRSESAANHPVGQRGVPKLSAGLVAKEGSRE
jgi:hypothetical protein